MKTITFYSYKGGVGRSLALANIATRLAEFQRKVCLLDFDLEAPGLQFKFLDSRKIPFSLGIVDYIHEFSVSGVLPKSIKDYTLRMQFPQKADIDLIPSGNIDTREYWKKLSEINWSELLYKNKNGVRFLLDLKEKIRTQLRPDYLLIDSRTGISEMSGITLSLLADEIVIVAANNKENLHGSQKVVESLVNPRNVSGGRLPKITFVLSRIPFTDNPADKTKEQNLLLKIKREYFSSVKLDINVIHSDRELEENEKIKIGYEKDSTTAQIAKDYLNLFEQLTNRDFSEDEISRFRSLKKAETYMMRAASSKSPAERLTLVTQAIELVPQNANFLYFRASEYFQQKDYENALNDLTTLGKYLKNYIPGMELLARVYVARKFYTDARKTYLKILSILPRHIFSIVALGQIFLKEGEIEHSLHYFNLAIEYLPENPEGFIGRANCYRTQKHLDKAFDDIFRALELDPNNVGALLTMAQLKYDEKQLQEFYLYLEMALKVDPKFVENYFTDGPLNITLFNEPRFLKLIEKYNLTQLPF